MSDKVTTAYYKVLFQYLYGGIKKNHNTTLDRQTPSIHFIRITTVTYAGRSITHYCRRTGDGSTFCGCSAANIAPIHRTCSSFDVPATVHPKYGFSLDLFDIILTSQLEQQFTVTPFMQTLSQPDYLPGLND
jgi:hypothetical protein